MVVENTSDELWLGVKGQSNIVIAGSPRNSFRASLVDKATGVEYSMSSGPYQDTKLNETIEYCCRCYGSQNVGAKLHAQKGNSPDRRLRSRMCAKW